MKPPSAGLLMYRRKHGALEVLLGHLGGPFWSRAERSWDIPKGGVREGETLFKAAQREFEEETGLHPEGSYIALGEVTMKSGKTVHVWAFEGDWDPALLKSASVVIEWPPRSGKTMTFPEMSEARFFELSDAQKVILPGVEAFLPRLEEILKDSA